MNDRTSEFYDALVAFQNTHRLPGLQHAQLRGLLAEHLARVFPAAAGVVPAADQTELTAEEARNLADDLGLQLYRAQDALAFVEECCVIADREQRPVTTADVREWLKGARCGRQLVADAADQTERRDRIADAVTPLLLDTLPKAIARARGYEIADAVMAVADTEQAELRRRITELESQCRDVDRLRDDWVAMRDRAEALDARVRELAASQPPAAPCKTIQHCAHHGWCRRCDPDFAALMSRINVAIQRTDADESHWGPLYEAIGRELRSAVLPDTSRAAVLREAADRLVGVHDTLITEPEVTGKFLEGMMRAVTELRRMAAEEQPGAELRRVAGGEQPAVEQPTLRARHRAAWAALTPAEQDARITALDATDGEQDGEQYARDDYEATTGHAITCLAVAGGDTDPDCPCTGGEQHTNTQTAWGVCGGCGASAGPDCDFPPDTGDDHSCAESGCTGEPGPAHGPVASAVPAAPDRETAPAQHAPGKATLCPDCRAKGHSICTEA